MEMQAGLLNSLGYMIINISIYMYMYVCMYLYIYVYMYVFFPILTWSPIAQLVERAAVNRKVDGSSPSGRVVQEKVMLECHIVMFCDLASYR